MYVCMYAHVYVCIKRCVWVNAWVYVCLYLYLYVCGCTRMCLCARVGVAYIYAYMYVFGYVLQCFGFVWWDLNPAIGDPNLIRICARYRPDTMVIQRSTHGMIRRSVPVRAVKTKRWFSSETTSFHVSVHTCVFPYLPLSVCVYMLHLSFHVTFYYILPVWLLLPLHETFMIVHFNYIVDMSLYQYHFMCW